MAASNLDYRSRYSGNGGNTGLPMRPDALTPTVWERHGETETVAGPSGDHPALCPLCKVPLKISLGKHLTLGCNALS